MSTIDRYREMYQHRWGEKCPLSDNDIRIVARRIKPLFVDGAFDTAVVEELGYTFQTACSACERSGAR